MLLCRCFWEVVARCCGRLRGGCTRWLCIMQKHHSPCPARARYPDLTAARELQEAICKPSNSIRKDMDHTRNLEIQKAPREYINNKGAKLLYYKYSAYARWWWSLRFLIDLVVRVQS